MFKLNRLEIRGFKSFADHTELHFGDGITAIVGPNGCGKSNISEAICWVLGEQRAKTLRGSEMQDLIFQGTTTRAASSLAEVILHLTCTQNLSNETKKIDESLEELEALAEIEESENPQTTEDQVDEKTKKKWKKQSINLNFAIGEQISIARRIFRSGESEYLLNGRPCRLRDIRDLLAGTGLSGARYAIIEQGYIGQILSTKPTDRRALIEEAAGISKFRIRQKMAEARLDTAKHNLTRIDDITQEIEKQVAALRRQASKTQKYKKLKESLREILKKIFASEGIKLIEEIEKSDDKINEIKSLEDQLRKRSTEKEKLWNEIQKQITQTQGLLKQLQEKQTESLIRKNQLENELNHARELIARAEARIATIEIERAEAEKRLKFLEEEIESLQNEYENQSKEADSQRQLLYSAEKIYESELKTLKELEQDLANLEAEKKRHSLALERLNELIQQHKNSIEKLIERSEGLLREGERAEQNFREYVCEIESLTSRLNKLRADQFSLLAKRDEILRQADEKRKELIAAEKNLKELQQKLFQSQHLLKNLQELESKKAIYEPVVQKIFANKDHLGLKLKGILVDKFNVTPDAERAVESVFGQHLQTVLVPSVDEAMKLMDYLNKNKLGRIGILVVPEEEVKQNGNQNSSQIGDIIGVSEPLKSILKEIFSREVGAKLVESIEPTHLNGEFLVDKKGNVAIGGRFFIGGAVESETNSSPLVFKRRLRELKTEISKLNAETTSQETLLKQIQESLSLQQSEIEQFNNQLNIIEKDILSIEVRLTSLKKEQDRAERHKKIVAEELKQIEAEIANNRKKLAEIEISAQNAEKVFEASTQKLTKLSSEISEMRKSLENKASEVNQKRTQAQITDERRRLIASSLRRVENETNEIKKRLNHLDLERKENQRSIDELSANVITLQELFEQELINIQRLSEEISESAKHLEELSHSNINLNSERDELNQQILHLQSMRSSEEIKRAEAVANLRNLNENCLNELSTPLENLLEKVEIPTDFELAKAYEQAEEIKKRLDALGAVNMLALEELEEASKRLQFLNDQRRDILESIQDAQEALSEIRNRSKDRFLKAFQIINENFGKIFAELFGGGKGEMRLIESDDVLEAGIEIIAQPPGKRLQNILLLSGGEKAMAALALTLAIFEYQPAPFCILDEVDAPLDDANIKRFTEKLRQMASKTQFIVITHNKKTMETAERLYGVTMQEKGVSKVVSVKLT